MTLSNRAERRRPLPLAAALLTVASCLSGCGSAPVADSPAPPPAAPPGSPPASSPATAGQAVPPGGPVPPGAKVPPGAAAAPGALPFEALPSPRQVVAAVPFGRRDPFATLVTAQSVAAAAAAAGGPEAAAQLAAQAAARRALLLPPPGLRLTGVLQSGGHSEAVVEYKDASGSLRPGDRGGENTELLPPGWRVAAIDIQRGQLTLQTGRRRVVLEM